MEIKLVDKASLYDTFSVIIKKYETLKDALVHDLEKLLRDHGIKVQKFDCRIKEYDTFIEKVGRKKYENPFEENEDFCGFRIVCFYLDDLEKIDGLIGNWFHVIKKEDSFEKTEVSHFGYRSRHHIVQLNENWLRHPKFVNLGLENLKFEIQIRTINMHSWGEASHNLDYKYEDTIPKPLRRKLFRASAFLEQADFIFEELRKEKISLSADHKVLSTDSLKAYLADKFPERSTPDYKIYWLYEEMIEARVSFNDIDLGFELLRDDLEKIEFDMNGRNLSWGRTGIARAILDITVDSFFTNRRSVRNKKWYDAALKWRNKYQSKN